MIGRCRYYQDLYRSYLARQHYDSSPVTAPISLDIFLEGLFEDGITLQRIVLMYAYGGVLALEMLKRNLPAMSVQVPEWIDTYISKYIRPRVANEYRLKLYEKLFHLVYN